MCEKSKSPPFLYYELWNQWSVNYKLRGPVFTTTSTITSFGNWFNISQKHVWLKHVSLQGSVMHLWQQCSWTLHMWRMQHLGSYQLGTPAGIVGVVQALQCTFCELLWTKVCSRMWITACIRVWSAVNYELWTAVYLRVWYSRGLWGSLWGLSAATKNWIHLCHTFSQLVAQY